MFLDMFFSQQKPDYNTLLYIEISRFMLGQLEKSTLPLSAEFSGFGYHYTSLFKSSITGCQTLVFRMLIWFEVIS